MTSARGKYVLGREVTPAARARSHTPTVVLSVRVSKEDLAVLEAASRATGRPLSQLVREAIRAYPVPAQGDSYWITVAGHTDTLSFGQVWRSGVAVPQAVEVSGGNGGSG